jgi:hypothetical protein
MTYTISPAGWSLAVVIKAAAYAGVARRVKGQSLSMRMALLFGVVRALVGLALLLILYSGYSMIADTAWFIRSEWVQPFLPLGAVALLALERFLHWYAWARVAFPQEDKQRRRRRAAHGVGASFLLDVVVLVVLWMTPWAWEIMSMTISLP